MLIKMKMNSEREFGDVVLNTQNNCEKERLGSNLREKILHILRNISIEPVLLCYVMPAIIMVLATQNLNLDKACRVNHNYGNEVCDRIINQNITNLTEQVREIQKTVANMQVWKYPILTTIPAILIMFIGSWSDRSGRRKPFMMLPLSGEIITCLGIILSVYYFLEWPLEVTGLIEALPSALGGGFQVILMSVFTYLVSITDEKNRTFRLGIANIVAVIGMPIGQAISGVLIRYTGYYGVFSIVCSLFMTAFIYTWVRIKDTPTKTENGTEPFKILDFFNLKHARDTFSVLLKPREASMRTSLIALVCLCFLVQGPALGELGVIYLFARYKFGFTEIEYSIYATYSSIIHLLGTMFAFGILNRRYNVNDYFLGILAASSKVIASFIFAFSPTVYWFYLGPVVECFSGFAGIIIKAMVSKIVGRNEVGRMYSILGILEAMSTTVFHPIYNEVYLHTLDVFPGAFFFIGTLTSLPSILVYIIMYKSQKKLIAAGGVEGAEETTKGSSAKEVYSCEGEVTRM